jgi:lipid II:glycine glycyltransferase (peptidoglycan interpeptide bridge formation enzyme)
LIASRQPEEITKLVEDYNKDLEKTEASYLDIIIKSGGLLSYKDVMTMPVGSLTKFVERYNAHTEEQNQQMKAAQSKGRR